MSNDTFLYDIVSNIHVSKHSNAYLLDKDGYTIADGSSSDVTGDYNVEMVAETERSLKSLAKVHAKMRTVPSLR